MLQLIVDLPLAAISWSNCFLCDFIFLTVLLQFTEVCKHLFMHSSLEVPRQIFSQDWKSLDFDRAIARFWVLSFSANLLHICCWIEIWPNLNFDQHLYCTLIYSRLWHCLNKYLNAPDQQFAFGFKQAFTLADNHLIMCSQILYKIMCCHLLKKKTFWNKNHDTLNMSVSLFPIFWFPAVLSFCYWLCQ